MPRAEISEFVHVVMIEIHFHVSLEILKQICLSIKKKQFFRWVDLYGAPCNTHLVDES